MAKRRQIRRRRTSSASAITGVAPRRVSVGQLPQVSIAPSWKRVIPVTVSIPAAKNALKEVSTAVLFDATFRTSSFATVMITKVRAWTDDKPSEVFASVDLHPGYTSGSAVPNLSFVGRASNSNERASVGYILPIDLREPWNSSWIFVKVGSNCTKVQLLVDCVFM